MRTDCNREHTSDPLDEALMLARRIEDRLAAAAADSPIDRHLLRLTRALAGSLADHLSTLRRKLAA